MMTCKEVSTLISTGGFSDAPLTRRLGVRLHLLMCRHCRAFRRQLEAVARSARAAAAVHETEPSRDFESKIAASLKR